MTDSERIKALQVLGYNDREAGFLCLAALHSGYFLRRQYYAFASVESGKAALLLEENLLDKRHAKVISFARGTQLYHLCSRPFYHALQEGDNRHRRSGAPLSIKWGFRRRRTLIPKGTRTAFRAEGEQYSERSDAGISIVREVFVFVKGNLSGAQRRNSAAGGERGAGKGAAALVPASTHRNPGERQLDG
jgi:hypothetical protein